MQKWETCPLFQFLEIAVGLGLCCAAYNLFLTPNDVAPGGFTGIGQLLHHLTGFPVGLTALLLNVPLFLLSMRSLGLAFGARSLAASLLLSLLLDTVPVRPLTGEPMLAALFGGVLGGIGFGLIQRGNATTGGSDMLGRLLHAHVPVFRIGAATFAVDTLVVTASGFVFDITSAMYALISAWVMGKMMDTVIEGMDSSRAYLIVSDKSEAIARAVLDGMERGVTKLHGEGAYSGTQKDVLLCVINRGETMQLRRIVAQMDPAAFMVGADAREVLGEGFERRLS